jgi:hypothetical protein
MREFDSFSRFARALNADANRLGNNIAASMKVIARDTAAVAKAKIATYQPGFEAEDDDGMVVFPEWRPLADSTLLEKWELGYSPPDNPLLRTGQLRQSIGGKAGRALGYGTEHFATVYSTDPIMLEHEFGTHRNGKEHVPPRPVIGAAMAERMDHNLQLVLIAIDKTFVGGG